MKSTNTTNLSDRHHELQSGALGEPYIKSFSQRTGEQAGQLITDFLAGILFLFLVDRLPRSVQTPAVTPNSNKLMTAHEIAVILNVSKAKAYQLIQKGEIPAVKFGRTTRVRTQDLERFLKDHIVHVT